MARYRSLVAAWNAADASRRMLVTAGIAILIAAALLIGWVPLTSSIARAADDVARSRLELQIARERVADSVSLSRTSAPVRAGDVRTAVERVLADHALRATPLAAGAADDRVSVVVADGRFDAIVNALDALARDDGVRLVEGSLTALVEPGVVRAELTFGR